MILRCSISDIDCQETFVARAVTSVLPSPLYIPKRHEDLPSFSVKPNKISLSPAPPSNLHLVTLSLPPSLPHSDHRAQPTEQRSEIST